MKKSTVRDPNMSKKVAATLLAHPRASRDIKFGTPDSRSAALQYLKVNRLATYQGLPGGKGIWRLTTKGAVKAAQWDYELKMDNNHPSQEPVVTKMPKMPEPVVIEPGIVVETPAGATFSEPDDRAREIEQLQNRINFLEDDSKEAWASAKLWQERYVKLAELIANKPQ